MSGPFGTTLYTISAFKFSGHGDTTVPHTRRKSAPRCNQKIADNPVSVAVSWLSLRHMPRRRRTTTGESRFTTIPVGAFAVDLAGSSAPTYEPVHILPVLFVGMQESQPFHHTDPITQNTR